MENSSAIKKVSGRFRVAHAKCPGGHSLMDKTRTFDGEKAVALLVRSAGNSGMIYLNPFYGRFQYECEIPLAEGEVVELFCPECETSLQIDTICRLCNIPMVGLHLPDGGQVEVCPKIGCHNHALKIVDLDAQLERMYVDEIKVQM